MNNRQFTAVALIAAIAALAAGLVGGRFFRPEKAIAEATEISAQQMGLVDADGNLRVLMDASGAKVEPAISFFETSGTVRATYSVNANGESIMVMNNPAGNMALAVGVTNAGGPGMLLKNGAGKIAWTAPPAAKSAKPVAGTGKKVPAKKK